MNKHTSQNIKEAWTKCCTRYKIGHYDKFVVGFSAGLSLAMGVLIFG